jgi:catalase
MVRKRRIHAAGWCAAAVLLLSATGLYAFGHHSRTPADPMAGQLVDAFETASGPHPGFRRNHAKGICVSGSFQSNGSAAAISRAQVFRAGSMPVVGRFSLPGGDPSMPDGDSFTRSMALWIMPPGGPAWRLAMNSVPVFPVRTPDALLALLQAMHAGPHGHPDPARMRAFLEGHPSAHAFQDWIRTHEPSSGYDDTPYYSVNAFRFVDAQGHARAARWRFTPETPYRPMAHGDSRDPDFLSFDLGQRLARAPLRWHLVISMAMPGDAVDDATQLWPARPDRPVIDAGTLVIEKAESQVAGPCRDIDFDPLDLPDGIAPSDDPLLRAREAAYAESFRRRMQEQQGG